MLTDYYAITYAVRYISGMNLISQITTEYYRAPDIANRRPGDFYDYDISFTGLLHSYSYSLHDSATPTPPNPATNTAYINVLVYIVFR